MAPIMTRLAPVAALAAMATLSGCISFGAKPPPTLMTIKAESQAPAGQTRSASDKNAVSVLIPTTPQALATQRVPVQAGENAIAYLKDALWVEAPARLFRTLLAETIEVKTGRYVPEFRGSTISPDTRLGGRLDQFGLEAGSRTAVVRYTATLIRAGRMEVQERRFEARVPVASETADAVAAGLSTGANQVANEVADWVGK
ncbi:ABC-type transport auxiliary lipoprotein family protein [Sphingomonas naphthae]|uniref:ABC-type transport auxiliary lipoprotein family protein n=1 Tax=Sphingomonas naphthae TaxID=1813468 RepID=A0ABY7TQ43_9SPHN|nr:ABC-type transport auxiliary lipoprotein family protein [Sphingomonas naphthae]WCT75362.1 ABC-type transport auxiliary lipoprotein family protein [Sphingomonas naphthae]